MNISMPDVSVNHLAGVHFGFENMITRRWQQRADSPTGATKGASPVPFVPDTRKGTSIRIGVAQSSEHIEAAAILVRQRYSWRGYCVDNDDETPADEPSRQEITFIAVDGDVAHGTLTLGLDGPEGLRAEETHGDAIEAARAAGRRVCELTRLAVATGPESRNILASLFSLAYAAGRTLHGAHDVFIEVNPRHVGFYERILGFVVAAGAKICQRVNAPSVLMRLDLDTLEERLRMLGLAALSEPLLAEAA